MTEENRPWAFIGLPTREPCVGSISISPSGTTTDRGFVHVALSSKDRWNQLKPYLVSANIPRILEPIAHQIVSAADSIMIGWAALDGHTSIRLYGENNGGLFLPEIIDVTDGGGAQSLPTIIALRWHLPMSGSNQRSDDPHHQISSYHPMLMPTDPAFPWPTEEWEFHQVDSFHALTDILVRGNAVTDILSVREYGTARDSVDAEVPSPNRTIEEVRTELARLINALDPMAKPTDVLREIKHQNRIGRIAAGIHSDGQPFVTIYHSSTSSGQMTTGSTAGDHEQATTTREDDAAHSE